MALVKKIVIEENAQGTSVKWVNEHGHDVLYCPATTHYVIGPNDKPTTIYLMDPDTEDSSHYKLIVQGMTICGGGHVGPNHHQLLLHCDAAVKDVTTVPLLVEHYPLFMVMTASGGYPMNEYYAKELFKTDTKA